MTQGLWGCDPRGASVWDAILGARVVPDPEKVLRTLEKAAAAFRQTPGRRGHFVSLDGAQEVLVAGDLHGNLDNFKRILDVADLAKQPGRHLVLQEVIHGPFRYAARAVDTGGLTPPAHQTDGGDQSHRLLDLCAALKCQYPERVHLLIGNHELSQWTNRAILKNDEDLNQVFRQGVQTAYGDWSEKIYAAYESLFAVIPAALRTPNRIFLSHSLPNAKRLETWTFDSLCKEEYGADDFKPGGGLHSIVWGRDTDARTAERFLSVVDADLLITGHIPCDDGYMIPNGRQIIVDCKDEKACVCLFPTDKPLTHNDLLGRIIRLASGVA